MKKATEYRYNGALDPGWFSSLASETVDENLVGIEVRKILGTKEGVETLGDTEKIFVSITGISNDKQGDGSLTISGTFYSNRKKFVFQFFRSTSEGILRIQP